jgi:hypothetical protein
MSQQDNIGKRRLNVVSTVFPSATVLFDYCCSLAHDREVFAAHLVKQNDPTAYKTLLHTSLILPSAGSDTNMDLFKAPASSKHESAFPIRDIIARLVEQLVKSNQSYHEQNCLSLGYRSKSSNKDATAMRSSHGTEMYFVNTVQAIITTQVWQLLANRIG